jgi:hypothetical protein
MRVSAAHPHAEPALVFDGYRPWRSPVTLQVPYNTLIFTCIWVKNNQLASAKPAYNVRAEIEYFHNGSPEFIIDTAQWWSEPTRSSPLAWRERIDLEPSESQAIPVFMQPTGVASLDPPFPQSALDGFRNTRPLRPGRWLLRLTITADAIEPIEGEIEFTIYQQIGEQYLSIGSQPPMGNVRLPLRPTAPAKSSLIRSLWAWVGGRWQWAPIFGAGATLVRFGEYAIGVLLLLLAAFAAASKISHWIPDTGSPWPRRTLGYFLVLSGLPVAALITFRMKGNDPWSHLQTPVRFPPTQAKSPITQPTVAAAAPPSNTVSLADIPNRTPTTTLFAFGPEWRLPVSS